MRTRYAGSLRSEDVGTTVTVCGWVSHRRDHGGIVFLDVRDVEGLVQVVADPADAGCDDAHRLRSEWVVRVTGEVRPRPAGTVNADLATGEVEIGATAIEVLNESEALPFPLDDSADVDDMLRLRYRYLDLRRPRMARNLRVRAKVVSAIRRSMDDQGFTEVTTPSLTRSTPEGARDFLVPSRLQPGTFFALPQSPQLFKQLLMVAGLDRYYQVAQCWRDEDLRADRQFEFVQMDVEMSFVDSDDVMSVIEIAVADAAEAITGTRPSEFPRMPWHEAMARYGSDKPDTRFGLELVDVSEVFASSSFNALAGKPAVGLRVPAEADASRSQIDRWTDRAKKLGGAGLVWMRVRADELESPIAKFLTDDEMAALRARTALEPGDLLLIVADPDRHRAQTVLGALRLDLGRPDQLHTPLNFLWVVDFPLFEGVGADGRPQPAHHPFTRPHPDDVDYLTTDPQRVRSLAYDLVVNGVELGSGSVRIHDRELQQEIFGLLGIDAEEAQARFGFLLDAFRYGAPPHAGFAFGVDRVAMILAGETSLRDVIAFPKTQSGADPLTGAPAPVDDAQLKDLGITVVDPTTPG
jgi:aspartyl-tRNA synthetase